MLRVQSRAAFRQMHVQIGKGVADYAKDIVQQSNRGEQPSCASLCLYF